MKQHTTRRIISLMKRYGREGWLSGPGSSQAPGGDRQKVQVLINDLRPMRHPDLPDGVIAAEGVLFSAVRITPNAGMRLKIGQTVWILETIMPMMAMMAEEPAVAEASDHGAPPAIFNIQLSQAVVPD